MVFRLTMKRHCMMRMTIRSNGHVFPSSAQMFLLANNAEAHIAAATEPVENFSNYVKTF